MNYFAENPECYWAAIIKFPKKRSFQWIDDNSTYNRDAEGFPWHFGDLQYDLATVRNTCACYGRTNTSDNFEEMKTSAIACYANRPGYICEHQSKFYKM